MMQCLQELSWITNSEYQIWNSSRRVWFNFTQEDQMFMEEIKLVRKCSV